MKQAFETLREDATVFFGTTLGAIVLIAALLLFALAWCRIFARAGFKASTGVFMLVPVVNVGLFLWLAFAPWPARRQTRDFERVQRVVHRADKHKKRVEAA